MSTITGQELERLEYFLKGDKHALLLCLDMVYVGHLWDDLIDKDRERTNEEISQAFMKAFRGIPDNSFFKKWQHVLQPLLIQTAQAYLDSTNLELGDDDERLMAFLCRNQCLQFIEHVIYVVGIDQGEPDWITEVSIDFWKTFKWAHKLNYFMFEEAPRQELVGIS